MNTLRKILKWIGIVLGGLVGMLALAVAVLSLPGSARFNKMYEVNIKTVDVPAGTQAVEHSHA